MRAIYVSVYIAPVRGALSHGAPIKVLHYYCYYYYYYYYYNYYMSDQSFCLITQDIVDWYNCIRAAKWERRRIAFPDRDLHQVR